jgi:hypothetical protein
MTLDTRATRAARQITESVSTIPVPTTGAMARRHLASMVTGMAAAAIVLLIGIGSALFLPGLLADDPIAAPPTTLGELTTTTGPSEGIEGDPAIVPAGGPIQASGAVSSDPVPSTLFEGTAAPGTLVTAMSEYGSATLTVDESGAWQLELLFEDPPANQLIPITLTVGADVHSFSFTWTWTPVFDISAHQAFAVSDDAEPYSVFEGTAPPGTEILVTSEYGGADGVAGQYGTWRVEVWLDGDMPKHTEIPIMVAIGDETFQFGFTWVYEESPETTEPPAEPPVTGVTVHQNNTVSDDASPYVKFHGLAPEGTHIVILSEYGAAETTIETSGEWLLGLWFEEGLPTGQEITVTVKVNGDVYGTYGFTWLYDPANTPITVHQHNTTSDTASPYVKFYGTAPAGTRIKVVTDYGSADMTTQDAGEWHLAVWLEGLPTGEPIAVRVRVNGDLHDTYQFTWLYDPAETEFTITQYNDVSDAPEPWTKFTGTAAPGTHILATSEWGSADVVVGDSGEYILKVWFSTEMPTNTEIPVSVKVDGDVHSGYGFTWLQGE